MCEPPFTLVSLYTPRGCTIEEIRAVFAPYGKLHGEGVTVSPSRKDTRFYVHFAAAGGVMKAYNALNKKRCPELDPTMQLSLQYSRETYLKLQALRLLDSNTTPFPGKMVLPERMPPGPMPPKRPGHSDLKSMPKGRLLGSASLSGRPKTQPFNGSGPPSLKNGVRRPPSAPSSLSPSLASLATALRLRETQRLSKLPSLTPSAHEALKPMESPAAKAACRPPQKPLPLVARSVATAPTLKHAFGEILAACTLESGDIPPPPLVHSNPPSARVAAPTLTIAVQDAIDLTQDDEKLVSQIQSLPLPKLAMNDASVASSPTSLFLRNAEKTGPALDGVRATAAAGSTTVSLSKQKNVRQWPPLLNVSAPRSDESGFRQEEMLLNSASSTPEELAEVKLQKNFKPHYGNKECRLQGASTILRKSAPSKPEVGAGHLTGSPKKLLRPGAPSTLSDDLKPTKVGPSRPAPGCEGLAVSSSEASVLASATLELLALLEKGAKQVLDQSTSENEGGGASIPQEHGPLLNVVPVQDVTMEQWVVEAQELMAIHSGVFEMDPLPPRCLFQLQYPFGSPALGTDLLIAPFLPSTLGIRPPFLVIRPPFQSLTLPSSERNT